VTEFDEVQDKVTVAAGSFLLWIVTPAMVLLFFIVRWFDAGGFWYFR
jgi:hypothetical protein